MGRVLTNATTLQVAPEAALGTQPTSGWSLVEPTSIGKYGPTLTKLTREPISKNRQRRKGSLTDLDSSVEFEADITYSHMKLFAEGLMFSTFKGGTVFPVTAVTATGFTVAAGGALAAGTLIFARGFANPANNGLFVVGAMSAADEIKTSNLVAEAAAPAGATVEIAGVQGSSGDLAIDADLNLKSTTLDWTSGVPGLIQVGQFIWIGDEASGTNSFAQAADRGFARVMGKSSTVMVLDKKNSTFVADPGTGKSINILFGQFVRNVAVGHDDYLERTYHFELAYENLGSSAGDDMYEYAKGNYANEMTFDFQTANKATMKCNFIGTDCGAPTDTRATGADAAIPPTATTMFNTSVDFLRLRVTDIDETGVTSDIKQMSITIKNNVTAEKVLATLGGKYMNAGMIDVEVDAQVLFTSALVIEAMRNNDTVTMEAALRNEDGGFVLDIPAMTIENGDKEFPVNQTVTLQMKSMAFQHPTLGSSASMSFFPYLPAA